MVAIKKQENVSLHFDPVNLKKAVKRVIYPTELLSYIKLDEDLFYLQEENYLM